MPSLHPTLMPVPDEKEPAALRPDDALAPVAARWTRWMGGVGALLALLLGACASQQVERLASAPDEQVFQIQGNQPTALETQARRLCPYGHEVLGESQRGHRLENDPTWLGQPIGWVTERFDNRSIRARLLIRCKAAPAVAVMPAPAS